jgi:hypothetical protein
LVQLFIHALGGGAGRKKGARNKATAARQAAIAASGLAPLDFLLGVMRDTEADTSTRLDAAKAAAPYIHPKLANVEVTGKDRGPLEHKEVSNLEAARRVAFLLMSATRGSASLVPGTPLIAVR